MKYLVVFLIICTYAVGYSQLSGEIIYEEKLNLHARIPEDRAELKEMIPEFRTEQMVLLFNSSAAIYKKHEKASEEPDRDVDMSQRNSRMMRFRNWRSNHIVYQDYIESHRIEQREFLDKKFLITGEPHQYAWKLTNETKDVGPYTAHLATFSDSIRDIKAWYVPDIPVPLGPAEFGQLPGLVLHVDINDGERTITAQNIDLKEIDPSLLEKPTKGKELTQEEFDQLVKEKMQERGQHGPGMHIRTRRSRN